VSKERYFLVLHNSDLQYHALEILLPWLRSDEVLEHVKGAAGYKPLNIGRTQALELFLNEIQAN